MSMTAPGGYVTPASPVVVSQIERLNSKADQLLDDAERAVDGLQRLSFSNVDLDPRFQFSQEDLDALIKQLGPLPDIDLSNWTEGLDLSAGDQNFVFSPALLGRMQEALPDLLIPEPPSAPPQPQEPADPGDPVEPPLPQRPVLTDYQAPDVDLNIPVPEYGDYTSEVPFPTLRPIVLPDVPVINFDAIKFEGVAPVFQGTAPDPADFSFENEDYNSALLERVKTAALQQMNGEIGLPPAVEDALFERAREREMEQGERIVQQANEEWAAKGFRFQGGPLARRADRARFDASAKVSEVAREQLVEHYRAQVESFRNGVANAIACEELTMRLFAQAEDRRFQATRMKLDLTLAVFNAMVSKFNADANVFQVQAQVYRDRFAAEQAKVQVYSEQLRAQQLIGELNAQDVQIFSERLRALQINAEIYRARVQGYEARFAAIRAQVDIYRTQLESNGQLVNVYEADTRAFGEMVRASLTRTERFTAQANMYAKKVDAWRATYDGMLTGFNAKVEQARLKKDVYASNTDRLQAWATAETGRIRALADKYQAIAAEIGAKSESERSKYQLYLAVAQASIERMRSAADILMKNGEINIQSGLTAANLMLRARETAAQTLAQLAAGLTSAANVNASISDSSSSSIGYSFSGEIEVN